jgi:hypothetical protein
LEGFFFFFLPIFHLSISAFNSNNGLAVINSYSSFYFLFFELCIFLNLFLL